MNNVNPKYNCDNISMTSVKASVEYPNDAIHALCMHLHYGIEVLSFCDIITNIVFWLVLNTLISLCSIFIVMELANFPFNFTMIDVNTENICNPTWNVFILH